jgi:hypothetical protein
MDPSTIDGNANLQIQQDTLNFTENTASVKTISYVRADPANSHENLATFEDVPQTTVLPPLTLIEVPGDQPSVPSGKQLAFPASDIWVSGVIKKVAGIR